MLLEPLSDLHLIYYLKFKSFSLVLSVSLIVRRNLGGNAVIGFIKSASGFFIEKN